MVGSTVELICNAIESPVYSLGGMAAAILWLLHCILCNVLAKITKLITVDLQCAK